MRKINFVSGLFGLLGFAILIFAVVLAFANKDASPVLKTDPEFIREQIGTTLDAICQGDYAAASQRMYGQPELGMDRQAADPVGILLWDAFSRSLSYEFHDDYRITDSGAAQDVTIRGLDIASVTAPLGEYARQLLEQRVAQAEDPGEVYDEENNFREDLVMEVLYEAAELALAQDAKQCQWDVTVNLICENGQWWILPESGLLEAVSGGILK